MNEYLKQYIELQKQFRETKGKADSVRALYAFKEELEPSEDTQAKEVLVYVYDLLDFKKSAYELLSKIGDRSNPKVFRRLAIMKEYADDWGDSFALRKPRNKKTKKNERNLVSLLFGTIQTLWIPGLLSSLRKVWFVIAVARILIFTIPTLSIPWKILSICAQSALPVARRPGNTTAAFRTIALWMMV